MEKYIISVVAFDWRALVIFEYVKLGSLIIVDHLFALWD